MKPAIDGFQMNKKWEFISASTVMFVSSLIAVDFHEITNVFGQIACQIVIIFKNVFFIFTFLFPKSLGLRSQEL